MTGPYRRTPLPPRDALRVGDVEVVACFGFVWRRVVEKEWTLGIEDISEHYRTRAEHVRARRLDALMTPAERVYPAPSDEVRENLGLE